jgi:hypothetical protein
MDDVLDQVVYNTGVGTEIHYLLEVSAVTPHVLHDDLLTL